MEGCDAVVHAAAMYEVGHPGQAAPGDVRGQRRTAPSACSRRRSTPKVAKVVYVSTVGIFGNTHGKVVDETYEHPGKEFTSYYEETKLEAHRIAKRMIADGPALRDRPAGRRLRPRRHLPGRRPAGAVLRRQAAAAAVPRARHLPHPRRGHRRRASCSRSTRARLGETYVISGPATTMREAIETVAAVSGRKAPKRAMPTGADEGDDADRPPGRQDDGPAAEPARADLLRRRRHLLGQLREGEPRARLRARAAWRRACARRSRPTSAFRPVA